MMSTFHHIDRRPGERRDPYAVSFHFGPVADAFRNREGQGLWVPAFAGTTRGEILRERDENYLWSSSLHPPCRGVMISISSPCLSGVCAHLARGSTSKFSAIAKCVPSYSSSLSSASTLPAEISRCSPLTITRIASPRCRSRRA